MYLVVPDYALYEHQHWPSRYNQDHKHSFSLTLTRENVKRNNHWHIDDDIKPLFNKHGMEIFLHNCRTGIMIIP